MFRPIAAAAFAFAFAALAGCTEAPQQRSTSTLAAPPAASTTSTTVTPLDQPTPIDPLLHPLPPPGSPGVPRTAASPALTDPSGIESCREHCDRTYRICGDSTVETNDDRSRPFGSPRLFSQADDCRYQLDRCLKRCSTAN